MSSTPINLGGPLNLFCEQHLAPFRARWPYGYAGMMMVLFQHAVRDHEILRACGGDPAAGRQAEISRLEAAVREFGPMCCRIDEDELERWTQLALAEDLDPFVTELKALEKRPLNEAA